MTQATQQPNRFQQLLREKLRANDPKPMAVPNKTQVAIPAKWHMTTLALANEIGVSHDAALEMLFAKMQVSVDATLDALRQSKKARMQIDMLNDQHAKAARVADLHVLQLLGDVA